MSDPGKAVFLSYASQDAEAATRICEALRAAGVEVWFDRSELVGGDAWDAKIRGQIASCGLFVPVISANTQARLEGYFRIEWKLAAQRTHAMAAAKAFLLPVVIDDTRDAGAHVPEEFRMVQWTRAPEGRTAPGFARQVQKLPGDAVGGDSGAGGTHGTAPPRQAGLRRRWWPVAGPALAGLVMLGLWGPWRADGFVPAASAARSHPGDRPAAADSPVREWVRKARTLYEPWDLASGEDFAQAEALLLRALQQDPSDVDALVSQALLSCAMYVIPHDMSPERRREALKRAELAVKLAPQSDEARFAYAFALRLSPDTNGEAIRLLRQLVARNPGNKLMLRVLGAPLSRQPETREEGLELLRHAAALPGDDPLSEYVLGETLARYTTRYPEAIGAFDRAIARAPNYPDAYKEKIVTLLFRQGEIDAAEAALAQVPATLRRDDRLAYVAYRVAMAVNDPDRALRALAEVGPLLTLDLFDGPSGYLKGLAHRRAGRKAAAEMEWHAALDVIEARRPKTPADAPQLLWQAMLLALLGETAGAGQAYELHRQFAVAQAGAYQNSLLQALVPALLGVPENTLPQVRQWVGDRARNEWQQASLAVLLDPALDPWRQLPGFQALVAEAEAEHAAHRRARNPF